MPLARNSTFYKYDVLAIASLSIACLAEDAKTLQKLLRLDCDRYGLKSLNWLKAVLLAARIVT